MKNTKKNQTKLKTLNILLNLYETDTILCIFVHLGVPYLGSIMIYPLGSAKYQPIRSETLINLCLRTTFKSSGGSIPTPHETVSVPGFSKSRAPFRYISIVYHMEISLFLGGRLDL